MLSKLKTVILAAILFFATTQSLSNELNIVNEVTFEKIIDGKNKIDKYEASGVHFVDDKFYVVFDNNSQVARVNAKLSKAKLLGKERKKIGYEGITYNPLNNEFYLVEESLEHKGDWHARLSVTDKDFAVTSEVAWLDFAFESDNKGFEGLAVLTTDGTTYLLALCEGNSCKAGRKGQEAGGGTIQVFEKKKKKWKRTRSIDLPKSLRFIDYSGLDISAENILVVSSQESSALWVAPLDVTTWEVVGSGKVYTFPKNKKGKMVYCNVEGVSWIDAHRLVVVSDAKKKSQPKACQKKEQSIHIVALP
ncbi:MAG: hypothetical protein PF439_10460 [Helicobacteraceae bacterium]|jgi:uncharacterized protein YjiK|nr:hypothetical protein [Helicobacteraceae bacterium]